MEPLLFAVGTGVLATLIWWLGARFLRANQRLRLRRLAFRRRRDARRGLREGLAGDARFSMGRARVDLLARSFRVKANSRLDLPHLGAGVRLGARELVDHIEGQRGDSIYLVNADSGFGKTIFGLVLPLLRSPISRRDLFPCYLDLATAEGEQPLARLDELMDRLGRGGDIRGRPLVIFDAPNETVDPEHLAEALAGRRQELAAVRARLLFLFSFRHHSYAGRLRSALLDRGFDQLQNLELLFEIDKWTDLAFFPETIAARGGAPPPPEELEAEVQAYAARFPTPHLSREDVACFLEWLHREGAENREPSLAPSPAHLCLDRTLGDRPLSHEHLLPLARVAFFLLGRETTAASYRDIAEHLAISKSDLSEWVPRAGMDGLVHCGTHYLRFEDETTVRVLGAIEVARSLLEGVSPAALRGRTIYDVCAPYVQPALARLQGDGAATASPQELARLVGGSLRGSDAPYSFYAGVLCGEDTGVLEGEVEGLDRTLLHGMIAAIDEDRGLTVRESLAGAGRADTAGGLDPVLDQLFEVMAAYGRRAFTLLQPLLHDPQPLIKSQAAYLLLDPIQKLEAPLSPADFAALRALPSRMRGSDGNLHLRFHEVEVLEKWLPLFSLPGNQLRADGLSLLDEIAATAGDPGDSEAYGELQGLVGLRARQSARSPDGTFEATLPQRLARCLETLRTETGHGGRRLGEADLECWEVALGMAGFVATRAPRSLEFVTFVEDALDHEYWIIRWWAFANLIKILRHSSREGHRVVATRCARRAVKQLYTAVEPMGLKHRQCAEFKSVRDRDDEAWETVREALAATVAPRRTEPAGQALADRYYEAMGVSPDAYLAEFFRRLDGLIPAEAQ